MIVLIYRQWIHFNKMTPIAGSQPIHDKYYGKNKNFTRAVDELKFIREQALAQVNAETRSRIMNLQQVPRSQSQSQSRRQFQIKFKRLTQEEIDLAMNGDLSQWMPEKIAKKRQLSANIICVEDKDLHQLQEP